MKVIKSTVRNSRLLAGLALTILPFFALPAGAQSPTLGITNDSTLGVSVFWPVAQAGYSLQWTPALGAPITWQPYPALPSLSGDGNNLVMPLASLQTSNPQAFFELVSNAVIVPGAPTVVTVAAGPVNLFNAELLGTVQPNTFDTTYWYQWGTNITLGQTTSSGVVSGSNTAPVSVPVGIAGLTPATLYYFQLYGSNSAGISSGGELTFTTPTPLPDALVYTLSASNVTSSTAQLNGTNNPEGSYLVGWFQWGTTTNYGSNTPPFYDISQNYQAVGEYAVISNLTANTWYHYRIVAYNGGPDEALGNDVMFMTSSSFQQPPPSVTNLLATSVTMNSATLNAMVNPNGASTYVLFFYGITPSLGMSPGTSPPIGSDSSFHSVSNTIYGLMAGTTYSYTVEASSFLGGATFGPTLTFTTAAAPQAPPSVLTGSATSVTTNCATLNAMVNPNGLSTTAVFLYGTNMGNLTMSSGTLNVGTNTSFDSVSNTICGLTPNTTYYYTIEGYSFPPGSAYGVTNYFTTLCAGMPPTALTFANAGNITINSAFVTGLAYSNGSPATAYFEYGLTPTDLVTVSPPGLFPAGNINFAGQGTTIGNLLPNTKYYYQIVAYNSCGETNLGGVGNFTTVNPTAGMAFIAAGNFTMGDTVDSGAPANDNIPPVTVDVSAFYMDVNLVTLSQWQTVYNWATANGYGFVYPGSGKGPNYPVGQVDWYNVVKWSNARSQKAGLTPVYYTDPGFAHVYTNLETDAVYVNWTANGYRLPTEAEWEKAARGTLSGQRFPWGPEQTISESQANYAGIVQGSGFGELIYDLGPVGPNAVGLIGGEPYSSPVGSFPANGYGLYDMAGNAQEWCWDWYAPPSPTYPVGSPYLGGSDPHGAATGTYRVLRGGDWFHNATLARCADRYPQTPNDTEAYIGFRCVTVY